MKFNNKVKGRIEWKITTEKVTTKGLEEFQERRQNV